MQRVKLIILALLLLLIAGCSSVPVAEDLDQFQANEIISLLNAQGIASSATREASGRGKYSVSVEKTYYTQAKTLLAERGLPSPTRPTFEELVQPRGFLPNSREVDALRLDHALAIELENALAAHPGISSAKVIVRSRTVMSGQDPTVSVILQERVGKELNRDDIAILVKRAVPGVKREDVFITSTKEPQNDKNQASIGLYQGHGELLRVPLVPFLFNWRVPEDDYNAMAIVLVICFLILAFIGGLVGYWFGYFYNLKNSVDQPFSDHGIRSLRLDRAGRENSEV